MLFRSESCAGDGLYRSSKAGDAVKKSPHRCGLFVITNRGIRLRQSRTLCSARHNHIPRRNMAHHNRRHSTAAERSRGFYNAAGSADGHGGDGGGSDDGQSGDGVAGSAAAES